jgi:glycosyltransferase involved in cell wall biosynthesis
MTPGGMVLDMVMRRLVRDEILRRERDVTGNLPSAEDLPDYFAAPDDHALVAFLTSPLPHTAVPKPGRYLYTIYQQRPDVQQAYPDLHSDAGLEAFHAWVRTSGRHEHSIPEPLVPPAVSGGRRSFRPPLRTGVNIVGYFTADLGLGEAARGMLATLEQLGEPCAVINETSTSNRQRPRFDRTLVEPTDYDVNLVCVNSDQTPRVLEALCERLRRDQHTIGYWAWELEDFPPAMRAGVQFVDEIWTYSSHSAAAISRVVDLPVHVVPPAVLQHAPPARRGRVLGIDADFTFLFCFDANSCTERKNPEAVVRAFCAAFDPGEGPTLVVKSHNARYDARAVERLHAVVGGRPDIHVIDTVLDTVEMRSLIASCDCYVSLHRAEGFGYTMAEAMMAGVPVVATRYSGNLEFMDDSNSFLARAERSRIVDEWGPYPAGAVWAEPDVGHAARLMRLVYAEPQRREEVARKGQRDIETHHTPVARAPLVAARLAASRARSSSVAVADRSTLSTAVGKMSWRVARRVGRLVPPPNSRSVTAR